MRRRKTRKEKLRAEERRLKGKYIHQELYKQKREIEARLPRERKEKNKAFHICNLRIFRDTCNFLVPFVVCAGIAVGGGYLFGAGLPVKQDTYKKTKLISMSVKSIDDKEYEEKYFVYSPLSSLKDSSLTIYTPWEEKDGVYTRVKREYGKAVKSLEVIKALMRDDFDYILNSIDGYDEEIQRINQIDEEPSYQVEGNIYVLDSEDKLTLTESESANVWTTIIEALLAIGVGTGIALKRDFSYLDSIHNNVHRYKVKYKVWKKDLDLLKETQEKILSLRNGGRHNGN